MGTCCQPSENNALFISTAETEIRKQINKGGCGGLFKMFGVNINQPISLSASIALGKNTELTKMEDQLFNLINSLRDHPHKFINLIEKYKNLISVDPYKETYFIILNDSRVDLNQGQDYFIECQNFLKSAQPQKKLIKDDVLKIPRPQHILTDDENETYVTSYINNYVINNYNNTDVSYSNINYIIDQNVSDILFVLILNLVGVGGYDQIKKNFLLSADYDRVGITIDKIDPENNVYCYYCIFGKSKNL